MSDFDRTKEAALSVIGDKLTEIQASQRFVRNYIAYDDGVRLDTDTHPALFLMESISRQVMDQELVHLESVEKLYRRVREQVEGLTVEAFQLNPDGYEAS